MPVPPPPPGPWPVLTRQVIRNPPAPPTTLPKDLLGFTLIDKLDFPDMKFRHAQTQTPTLLRCCSDLGIRTQTNGRRALVPGPVRWAHADTSPALKHPSSQSVASACSHINRCQAERMGTEVFGSFGQAVCLSVQCGPGSEGSPLRPPARPPSADRGTPTRVERAASRPHSPLPYPLPLALRWPGTAAHGRPLPAAPPAALGPLHAARSGPDPDSRNRAPHRPTYGVAHPPLPSAACTS